MNGKSGLSTAVSCFWTTLNQNLCFGLFQRSAWQMRQGVLCANTITGNAVFHNPLCFIYYMRSCFKFSSMVMMVVSNNQPRKQMWTPISQWKLNGDFYEHVTRELHCAFIFFPELTRCNRGMLFLSLPVSSADRGYQIMFLQVALTSVFKLLHSSAHKIYAVKKITFSISSSPV